MITTQCAASNAPTEQEKKKLKHHKIIHFLGVPLIIGIPLGHLLGFVLVVGDCPKP